jgi:hypothetical protein
MSKETAEQRGGGGVGNVSKGHPGKVSHPIPQGNPPGQSPKPGSTGGRLWGQEPGNPKPPER